MSRETSSPRLGAETFFSRHSAQLIGRAPTICEWSSSGVLFVSSREAARHFFPLWFHFTVVTAPFVSETNKARIGLTASVDTSPRIRASQEPDGHNQEWFPGRERTLCQRRSSCLLFQMFGVETYLLLPDDQRDRGNLPRQGKTRHRWLPPFGEQGFVEIVEGSNTAAGF